MHHAPPICAFSPKYHWFPFLVWYISGSRSPLAFLVDEGAWMMVAPTIVPVAMRMPLASRKTSRVVRILIDYRPFGIPSSLAVRRRTIHFWEDRELLQSSPLSVAP